ncbi:FMN-linked oxidoreductase [Desarmillaria tabescens]|uniref:FMN-linked oxidoreductase n=1 Tax=Armillaria tabescens TaxID=1929756 RepID=A0AA39JA66_ARMTA|nr:FMN-linked oxidoreductase [Desarmillaria tabescens]KAK0439026.1 FMN-linked oxidoreductase [Desarmillaria tabescens]
MSALTRNHAIPTNVPNSLNTEYYRQRAAGGAGLINAFGIWSQEQVNGWKNVTDAVHEEGGVIFAQLWHLGRLSHPDAPEQIASGLPPSVISARGGNFRFLPGQPGYVTPTAIDDPRILLANGNRLLSTRNRPDVWGANRVGIKLNPAEGYNDVGMPLQETLGIFGYLISEIDRLGIAYVALVRYAGNLDPVIDGARRATKHDVLGTYTPLLKNPATNVFANALFTGEEAVQYVEDGKVDGVFFGIP